MNFLKTWFSLTGIIVGTVVICAGIMYGITWFAENVKHGPAITGVAGFLAITAAIAGLIEDFK